MNDRIEEIRQKYDRYLKEPTEWRNDGNLEEAQRSYREEMGRHYLSDVPFLLAEVDRLQKENEKFRGLLLRSLEKLRVYYEQTDGVYGGGEEHSGLSKAIDSALHPKEL